MTNPPARRSLRLRRGFVMVAKKTKPETTVFHVPELLSEIIKHCSWPCCVRLSHTAVHARIVVQACIRRRIHDILDPFVDDLSAFFALIKETKAGIVGSVAWNVMTIDDVGPQDVNIVVPTGASHGFDRLKALLSCTGTTVAFDGMPGVVYGNFAKRFVKLTRSSGSSITITLANQSSIIPVVISSPFTCQFNVLTATSLYCFYPKLLAHRESIRGMAPVYMAELHRLPQRGVRLIKSHTQSNAPCEEACLPVWRRTENLEGVGIMHWGGYDGDWKFKVSNSLTEDIEISNHKWRLGVRCFNPACQNGSNSTLI